jgi:hypothetical protein
VEVRNGERSEWRGESRWRSRREKEMEVTENVDAATSLPGGGTRVWCHLSFLLHESSHSPFPHSLSHSF